MTIDMIGRRLTLERGALWLAVVVTIPASLLAFQDIFRGPARPLIQGPLAVYPDLGDRLAEVLPVAFITWSQIGIHIGGFILFVGLGLLIAARASGRVPLVASAMLITLAASLFAPLSELSGFWARVGRAVGEVTPAETAGLWISLSGVFLLAFLLMLPTGELVWPARVALSALLLLGVLTQVFPGSPLDPHAFVDPWRQLWTAAIPGVAVAVAWQRLAKLETHDRRQWQPVLVALSLILAAYLVLVLLRPELQTDAFDLILVTPRLQALYGLNTLVLLTGAVFALPVSIVLAVVRYRLFEIDLLLNRALVYGSLTAIVTLIFGVVTLGTTFGIGGILGDELTGQVAALAGVLTGTMLALGLQPLRRKVQRAVDRRFYREKFNAEEALDQLTAHLGEVVDRALLINEVENLMAATLQPNWMSLVSSERIPPALAFLGEDPVVKPQPGVGVAVPLRVSGAVIGLLTLGERKSDVPYRGLELAFLARVGERLGPALRTVELVERQETDRQRQERVDQELSVARRIQRELLPKQVPQPPGWSFKVHYQPAREVGGDFYDFYQLGPGKIGVAVGDVTDKGMPAALVMASCRTVVRGVTMGGGELSPGEVLARSNSLLVGDIPEGMFITCLYGVVDLDQGRFHFANAGHNPPELTSNGTTVELKARGMPLGLMSGMEYEEMETILEPGHSLVFSSDGITEARSPSGEMFGFERFRDAIATAENGTIEAVLSTQAQFVGEGWEQDDDIMLIEISRLL